MKNGYKEIYLAGGCFWGVEKYFASINGIISTDAGYANGYTENPSYEDVVYRNTNHAETGLYQQLLQLLQIYLFLCGSSQKGFYPNIFDDTLLPYSS